MPETSNIYEFILAGTRCTLVEPDPDSVAAITAHFSGRDNVSLHPVAVYDKRGSLELVRKGASTYASAIGNSPVIVNDQYRSRPEDKFLVDAVTFDEIDDGSIDVLSIDIEGGEWFVLKHMVSRPAVISVETHGGLYRNPYRAQIAGWMRGNGYELWYKNRSDSVFVRQPSVSVSALDKARLLRANAQLQLKRIEKHAKRLLRGSGS